jgi:lysyl-tRNA synthetase class 2
MTAPAPTRHAQRCPRRQPADRRTAREAAARPSAQAGQGTAAFPNDFKPTHHAADLHQQHGQVPNEELEPQADHRGVAGRMMLKRVMGKACFAHAAGRPPAASSSTSRSTHVGADALAAFKHWDLGDILGCRGHAVSHQDR